MSFFGVTGAVDKVIGIVRAYKKGKRGYETPLLLDAYLCIATRAQGFIDHEKALAEAMDLLAKASLLETASDESEDSEQARQTLTESEE
jgi:hypothetical protein